MSDKNILSPGQPSLENRYNEPTKRVNITLPASFHEYIMDREARGVTAAEYLRRLIDLDRRATAAGVDLAALLGDVTG